MDKNNLEVSESKEGEERCLISYFKDLEDVPLLTPEEELNLARRIREGDLQAIDELTEANLRFVINIAKQYRNHGLSLSDLINEGNLGLIKAATKFDLEKGCRFITYAIWWIRQGILQSIQEKSDLIRQPASKIARLKKKQKLEEKYQQIIKEAASIDNPELEQEELKELLEAEKISSKDFQQITHEQGSSYISLDAPFSDDSDTSSVEMLEDSRIITPETVFIQEELYQQIEKLLSSLSERERQVIELYFGLYTSRPHTLEEIGQNLGLTRERIRQIKEQALTKLRLSEDISKLEVFIS
ncbi:MAG: RNA polymerase sigma factor RpoD/SigA [Candidatus Coatesbacteria bacterium]|nr:RNA polymerase sigma factor RpoD/SigA [Candidatus Coatesbacteria bacterium]